MKSIYNQFYFAVDSNFSERIDKHAYRKENGYEASDKVFSYSTRKQLLEGAKTFSNYIKENTDIKLVKNITADIINAYLDFKKEKGNTQNSIDTDAKIIKKLEILTEKTYNLKNLNWAEKMEIPIAYQKNSEDRGAKAQMSNTDLEKIISYCKEHKCQSTYSIQLESFLGIRVREIVLIKLKDIDYDKNTVKITGKGNKEITRTLTSEQMQLIKEIQAQKYDKDKLFNIKDATVNAQLRKIEDRLKLERHSVHDIRRTVAQNLYDKCREEGMDRKQALEQASKWLSHGEKRETMLVKSYIRAW